MYTNITISVPGIEVKLTDTSKTSIVFNTVASIMESIYRNGEMSHDVMVIFGGDEIAVEVILKANPQNDKLKGFTISGDWYCLPDAENVIYNIIGKIIQDQEDKSAIEEIFKDN